MSAAATPAEVRDLHSHTSYSDGVLTPGELVDAAAAAGVDVLAVTDHDTTEGVPEAAAAAARRGVRLVPGMEVSAHLDVGGADLGLHILGYFSESALPRLAEWQAERRRARHERLEEILRRLGALGAPVDGDAVRAGLGPRQTPGRPHVARALLAAGHVGSLQEAFERFLGSGGPANVPDRGPSAADAIALIHSLPGLAVVAHPVFDDVGSHLAELAGLGLDGVEAFHAGHEPDQAQALERQARELGLLVTSGSDFHGTEGPGHRLGTVRWPEGTWERFEDALRRRTGGER